MTKEEIKARRIGLKSEESAQRALILESHIRKYKNLEKDLMNECEKSGHVYQISFYRWGSFDQRRFTHETMTCEYCHKIIHIPSEEEDNTNNK